MEDDCLPKVLCYRCMYNLENFYDFRTACVNAAAWLERNRPKEVSIQIQIQNINKFLHFLKIDQTEMYLSNVLSIILEINFICILKFSLL